MLLEANLWDILTAIGTVGAVIVSVTLALRESVRAKRAESQLEQERSERTVIERRSVASLVSGWAESTYEPSPDGTHYLRTVTAHISNESNEPVYSVSVSVALGVAGIEVGPLAMPLQIPVLPARHHRTWDITTGLLAHSVGVGNIPAEPVIRLDFTDSYNKDWVRYYDGTLLTQATDTPLGASEDPSDSQLGPMENGFNPLFTVTAFRHLIEHASSPNDLKILLAPTAKGWSAMSIAEFIDLRDEVKTFGIAAYVWYPAPRVAYVRLIHDEDVERARRGEGGRMLVITLILIAGIGWKVFSVGGAVTEPDWIEYPRKDLHKDVRG